MSESGAMDELRAAAAAAFPGCLVRGDVVG